MKSTRATKTATSYFGAFVLVSLNIFQLCMSASIDGHAALNATLQDILERLERCERYAALAEETDARTDRLEARLQAYSNDQTTETVPTPDPIFINNRVAFTVALQHQAILQARDTVEYNTEVTHIGGGWPIHSPFRFFNSPISGVYVFILTGVVNGGDYMELQLLVQHKVRTELIIEGRGREGSQSGTTTLAVFLAGADNINDQGIVYVRAKTGGRLPGNFQNRLTGFLLQPMTWDECNAVGYLCQ